MSNQGFILWFTGLSGAGKSTLAQALTPVLRDMGCNVEVLDGDEVRENLSKGLGFPNDRTYRVAPSGRLAPHPTFRLDYEAKGPGILSGGWPDHRPVGACTRMPKTRNALS